MKRAHKAMLILAVFSLAPIGTANGKLLFSDDFSTGDFSKHSSYFRWGGSGTIPEADGSSSRITTYKQPDGTVGNVVRFTYNEKRLWQEVRFHLTKSVNEKRTKNGASTTRHPDLWIRYDMRIPDNFFHRVTDGTVVKANNKGWLYIWKDSYKNQPSRAKFAWWPVSQDNPYYGNNIVSAVKTAKGGHDRSADYVREQESARKASNRAWGIRLDERGQWIDYTFHVRASSGPDANDGVMEIYKDGQLAIAWRNINSWPVSGEPKEAGFDRGYLLGYHNSGYEEETTYYIDNFRIGTTATSVDLIGVAGKAPTAPTFIQ